MSPDLYLGPVKYKSNTTICVGMYCVLIHYKII